MNFASIVVLVLVAAAVIAAVAAIVRKKVPPCFGCNGDCENCHKLPPEK
ncbi:MAG: FeoB-associated Cys-rich membrane protein [Oscillospiraceae bacterium]|nr:FeoB-associated Cys-rich membrane protein [Oscillospiraceae bacterium]